MSASGLGSRSESKGEKGKPKEIENNYEKRKKVWTEEKMKMLETAFPNIKEDERLCKLIATQYAAEEEYQVWLYKYARIEFDVDVDDDSVREREVTQQKQHREPVQIQENADAGPSNK